MTLIGKKSAKVLSKILIRGIRANRGKFLLFSVPPC
jgi:hypothetical protein